MVAVTTRLGLIGVSGAELRADFDETYPPTCDFRLKKCPEPVDIRL